jgi:hypothetical protein
MHARTVIYSEHAIGGRALLNYFLDGISLVLQIDVRKQAVE